MKKSNSVRELLLMVHSFGREGIILSFSNEAVEKITYLCDEYSSLFAASIIIEAYIELRNDRTFDEWRTTNVEQNGSKYTVLCQLYRNRIFEVWTIS